MNMNEIKLKAALVHIGEGFYKLADAIEAPTTNPDQIELPLEATEEEPKPKPKKKAAKKKPAPKKEIVSDEEFTAETLTAVLTNVAKEGHRKEAMEIMDGRKVADLNIEERDLVYSKLMELTP
jgi:hypothetical protein